MNLSMAVRQVLYKKILPQCMSEIHLFDKKQLSDFSNHVRDVFNLMTVSRKYKVVGSAALKHVRYVSDYDLNELYEKRFDTQGALDAILELFRAKFKACEADPTCFVTDLKCGADLDNEPLRWSKLDIAKGFKILSNGKRVTFQECLLSKNVFKLDVVKIINGVFTEFSDNYLLKLGDQSNFFPEDILKSSQLSSLKHSYEEYFYTRQNLFKGLKRAFSYYLLDDEQKHRFVLEKLMRFFNSPVGLLYNLKGQLATLLLVIEDKQHFRTPKLADLRRNVTLILEALGATPSNDVRSLLQGALRARSPASMAKYLKEAEDTLSAIVNALTVSWVLQNKDVPLY